MSKVPVQQVLQEQIDSDIWDSDWASMDNEYWIYYWDDIYTGEMTWQWYMKLGQHKDWHTVIINPAYKNVTVANWIENEYPEVKFEYEKQHFLIETSEVATLVALKWA